MQDKKVLNNLLGVLPNDDVLAQCIHCGMCLAACPTYDLTMNERSSPRGRIKMIKSVARGEMAISDVFADEMDFCLDCQACETACPAGVKYGSMVEAARVEIAHAGYTTWWGKIIKVVSLNYLLRYKSALKVAAKLLYFYQNSGIQKLLHGSGLFKLLMPKMAEIDKLSPRVSKKFSEKLIPVNSLPKNEIKFKTAFLTGCVMDVAFAEINKDTVDVLTLMGSSVFTPRKQECCGSIHAHNGDMVTAKTLAKINIDAFEKEEYDVLVANSAGCGAFMKEYGHVLADDKNYAEKAKKFSSKVKDLSEFVFENLDQVKFKQLKETLTYHDACHLAHTQRITQEPRAILNAIPGLTNVPLNDPTRCCGSAGVYNIMRYDDSMAILKKKMDNIKATETPTVLASNPGCILQLQYGTEKFDVPVKVLHPATILKKALE
ncbi:MAG TPA: (Fe-S)-binding protein [Ignavibacteriaceae bacterium]|nr:(Fe-S)-binding protein [Ignavibacteriaceae bacterium]